MHQQLHKNFTEMLSVSVNSLVLLGERKNKRGNRQTNKNMHIVSETIREHAIVYEALM